MPKRKYQAELFLDDQQKWRWRIWAPNGRKLCTSGENFDSKGNARRALKAFLRVKAVVVEQD